MKIECILVSGNEKVIMQLIIKLLLENYYYFVNICLSLILNLCQN